MTKEETKQFNIRIAESLYNEIKNEADKQKITMTEYVVSKLTDDRPRIDKSYVEQLNNQIKQQTVAIQSKDEYIQELTDDSTSIDNSYKEHYVENLDNQKKHTEALQAKDERYAEQLEKQIEEQAKAIQNREIDIKELTRLLNQQQLLTLDAQKDKKQLSIEPDEIEEKSEWWQFWK